VPSHPHPALHRLRGAIEALSSALGLSHPQALNMLASDINLLDTPPLRVRQYLEVLSQQLGVSLQLAVTLAWQCPHLLCVEAAAVQVRCGGCLFFGWAAQSCSGP
jgi:hypothetical protein